MPAALREEKLRKQLETIKTFAEACEREQYKLETTYTRIAAGHFAVIAMSAEAILAEVNEEREAERQEATRLAAVEVDPPAKPRRKRDVRRPNGEQQAKDAPENVTTQTETRRAVVEALVPRRDKVTN